MVTRVASPNKGRAFTLIELLVVVSIIALLVSILLPALGKAREQAKAVVCMTRQKAIGMAAVYYMDDWNDMLFPYWRQPDPEGFGRYWVGKLREYIPDNSMTGQEVVGDTYNVSEVFYCPSYSPFSPERATTWSHCLGWREWAMDNTTVNDWNRMYQYRRMTSLSVSPAEFFLLADSKRNNRQWFAINVRTDTAGGRVHTRHSGRANTLFADTRVEAQPPSYFEMINDTQSEFHIRPVYRITVDVD